jgi:hypothetical protein
MNNTIHYDPPFSEEHEGSCCLKDSCSSTHRVEVDWRSSNLTEH